MAARVMVTAPRLRRFALLLLALLHQQLISEHLPDDLLGLGFGLLLELAKAGLLKENEAGAPMFPPSGPRPLLATHAALEAGSTQCNNPVAEQN